MEITGKLIQKLPQQTGTSKSGKDWVKQEFLIETEGQFPKKVCIQAFSQRYVDELNKHQAGDTVTVNFNLESKEFNGRYYTSVDMWKIATKNTAPQTEDHSDLPPEENQDDLPF